MRLNRGARDEAGRARAGCLEHGCGDREHIDSDAANGNLRRREWTRRAAPAQHAGPAQHAAPARVDGPTATPRSLACAPHAAASGFADMRTRYHARLGQVPGPAGQCVGSTPPSRAGNDVLCLFRSRPSRCVWSAALIPLPLDTS